jgi:hypothetical protein
MANFTAGTSFTDGVTNDVTAAKLNALVADAVPTSNLALASTSGTIANFTSSTANITLGTIPTLTAGTTTGTAGVFTSGTITTGVIPTGTFGTTTSTAATITTGTIGTLVATGTITGSTNVINIGSGQIYKDAGGNVGIGTTSPAGRLDVAGGSIVNTTTALGSTGFLTWNGTSNGIGVSTDFSVPVSYIDYPASFFVRDRSASFATRLCVNSSGNVGIGTTSPATKLHVLTSSPTSANEVARFQGGSNSANFRNYISLYTTNPDYWWELSNQAPDGGSANNGIAFRERSNAASVERLYIAQGGNVGIGTTSPTAKFQVNAATVSEIARIQSDASGDAATAALNIVKFDNNNTTSQVFLQFLINNFANGSGRINANGANAAAFGSYSDSRLKENITELPSQLANICLLKPSEFDYKNGSGHQIGFIAQEIQEIYPDVVGEGDGGMLTVTGWSKTEARLVKAIQELKSENDSLKSRIEALEAA